MKKAIKFLGVIVIAAFIGLSVTACKEDVAGGGNEITGVHSHSYGVWTTKTAATCTAAEVEKRTCSCGVE